MAKPGTIIVAMTGATGQLYGVKALEALAGANIDTHLILSEAAKVNMQQEGQYSVSDVQRLADDAYDNKNVGAPSASGSFKSNGMLVAPCSMKTLSNIATGNAQNLIARSADVMLKERRDLVLMPREKPFNRIHLENMLTVTDAGAIVFPPFPSFYQGSRDIDQMVSRTVARALTHLGVDVEFDEWEGISPDHD